MRKKSFLATALFLALSFILVLGACGNGNAGEDSSSSSSSESSSSSSSAEELSGKIIIGGSTALQPLAAQAAQDFMAKNPGVQIEVQGGGSGEGLTQVSSGNFQIGNSDVFAESKSEIDASALKDYKVAVVGMTAAVNPKAGVDNLSKEDLQKVFTGEVTNWKEVGGNDVKIELINRPEGSGTRATFDQFALDGKKPAEGATQDSSNTVKKMVAETDGAVGYLALSYFTDDSVVALSIDGVEATDENVASGKFPVWAYEHMYTKGEPKSPVKEFLDYMMSDEVQNGAVKDTGYIPVTDMQVELDAEGNTK